MAWVGEVRRGGGRESQHGGEKKSHISGEAACVGESISNHCLTWFDLSLL
jgi:hypothetical protein